MCCEKTGKKNILLVLTGGTVCSVYKGDVKSQNKTAGTVLKENFFNSDSAFAHSVNIIETENYGVFSENMTVDTWNRLLDRLRNSKEIKKTARAYQNGRLLPSAFDKDFLDGIIIAHGTDTLAFSSALFSLVLQNIGVPVFFVSSNEALSRENSNGNRNFKTAVECICYGIFPGVYVTYKNISDEKTYLHLGSRLEQCKNYSEDFFSNGMVDVSNLSQNNAKILFEKLPKNKNNGFDIDLFGNWNLLNNVLVIQPYVGLNYDNYNLSNVKSVLHIAYHSGTVCANKEDYTGSVFHLIDLCSLPGNAHNIYFAPAKCQGEVYDTVPQICEYAGKKHPACKVHFVCGCTTEMLYAKLLIAHSFDFSQEKTDKFLFENICNEFFE